jgi:hypothetical protein
MPTATPPWPRYATPRRLVSAVEQADLLGADRGLLPLAIEEFVR